MITIGTKETVLGPCEDTSFLEEQEPVSDNYAEELKRAVELMAELKVNMDNAEMAYNQAKMAYDTFRSVTMPQKLRNAGVEQCTLDSGLTIAIKQEITCSPNKNDKDRAALCDWLHEHEADYLVKKTYSVGEEDIEKLKAMGINFMEQSAVNTNSLKSWLKSQLGYDGISAPVMELTDVPDYVHFYVRETTEVK